MGCGTNTPGPGRSWSSSSASTLRADRFWRKLMLKSTAIAMIESRVGGRSAGHRLGVVRLADRLDAPAAQADVGLHHTQWSRSALRVITVSMGGARCRAGCATPAIDSRMTLPPPKTISSPLLGPPLQSSMRTHGGRCRRGGSDRRWSGRTGRRTLPPRQRWARRQPGPSRRASGSRPQPPHGRRSPAMGTTGTVAGLEPLGDVPAGMCRRLPCGSPPVTASPRVWPRRGGSADPAWGRVRDGSPHQQFLGRVGPR